MQRGPGADGVLVAQGAPQLDLHPIAVGRVVAQQAQTRLGGGFRGGHHQVHVSVVVEVAHRQTVVGVGAFQRGVAFAHGGEGVVPVAVVEDVFDGRKLVVVHDVQIPFAVVVVVEKDASPGHA